MCGIAGVVGPTLRDDERALVTRLTEALRHRGPDGQGRFGAPDVELGHTRLSIIDVAGSPQPLYNEDESLVLVGNGEIYNYVELWKELEGRGHKARTGGDLETILHLYEERGADCVRALRGMFAFALWDRPRRRLLLARDRMGEKPLYLVRRGDRLYFASELRALVGAGVAGLDLDPSAIELYFRLGYVPEPATLLVGVTKLPRAHTLLLDLATGVERLVPYWDMLAAPPLAGDPTETLRSVLREGARLVTRADVPVGVALSGGLDSSLVAALAAAARPDVLAFSVAYPGRPASDESPHAEALARHLGVPFRRVEVREDEVATTFPEVVALRDEPIADIAGHGYLAVARAAREVGAKVLLQGQGGDELFWGYPWVRTCAQDSRTRADLRSGSPGAQLPPLFGLRAPPFGNRYLLKEWLTDFGGLRTSLQRRRLVRSRAKRRVLLHETTPAWRAVERHRAALFGPALVECGAAAAERFLESIGDDAPADVDPALVVMRGLCDSYFLQVGLAQGDRLSMAASVELRVPLADHVLVETVVGLRKAADDIGLPPKQRLRDAAAAFLPPEVLARPKRGFTPPIKHWHASIFERHGASLLNGELVGRGLLTPEGASRLAVRSVREPGDRPLAFGALVLESWLRGLTAAAPRPPRP